MLERHKRTRIGVLSLVFAVGLGTAAAAESGALSVPAQTGTTQTSTTPTSTTQTSGADNAPARPARSREIGPTQGARLKVLRRARHDSDVLPAHASDRILRDPTAGLNPALSRHAVTTTSGEQYYLVPGTGAVCLYDQAAGGGCVSDADANAGRLLGADLCAPNLRSGDVRVYGLVPDGVTSVHVNLADGTHADAPVIDNVFAETMPLSPALLPKTVTWQDPMNGQHTQDVPLPPDATASPGCG